MPKQVIDFSVDLPAGGTMHLQTADEVALWEGAYERYKQDYSFTKMNDLFTLGSLLQQQIILFRCQTQINGMEPELDKGGVPTGSYRAVELDSNQIDRFQKQMISASSEMRALEKQLGIDKATRESGGAHTVDNYLKELKRAAHQRGIHISKRTLEYERVINDARVRIRILLNGDAEDRRYHNITPRTIIMWMKDECDKLEEVDKKFNSEKGKLYAGKL
jgi:hypothetical protein